MDNDIAAQKTKLRELLKQRRDTVHDASGCAAEALAQYAGEVIALVMASHGKTPALVVSSYMPIGSELDPQPLLRALAARGARSALPVIEARGKALVFRAYDDGDPLAERRWGIRKPLSLRPVCEPDILLLPLLAFDDAGWRLGYGGGFYDRTLQALRARKTVLAIGLAYDAQRVENVVHDVYDQPLDCVLTPSGLMKIQK